jgi:uncharacterized protein (DUF1330 family)
MSDHELNFGFRRRSARGRYIDPAMAPTNILPRLLAAYSGPRVDPPAEAWAKLVAAGEGATQPIAVLEFVSLRGTPNAASDYDAYLAALAPAVIAVGGGMISVNDTMMSGLEGLEDYAGGVSWAATFPTINAYIEAVLDDTVIAAASMRRAATDDAHLLAGANRLPDAIKQLPPNEPASAFPSARVVGKSPREIVDALLAVYPSGGADPTERALESMVAFPGFNKQRVHYINLYRFNEAPGGGSAALGGYNAAAMPVALAHGGRPKLLVDVQHHLVAPVRWNRFIFVSWPSLAVFTDLRLDPAYIEAQKDRVISAEQYGNLITIARADRRQPS